MVTCYDDRIAGLEVLDLATARLTYGGYIAPGWWWLASYIISEGNDFARGWNAAKPA